MNKDGKQSMEIGEVVTIAARRASFEQLKRVLKREDDRFRRLSVAKAVAGDLPDRHDVDELNEVSNILETCTWIQKNVPLLPPRSIRSIRKFWGSDVESVDEIDQQLRDKAKTHLNYEGIQDTEKLWKEFTMLRHELRSRQRRYYFNDDWSP